MAEKMLQNVKSNEAKVDCLRSGALSLTSIAPMKDINGKGASTIGSTRKRKTPAQKKAAPDASSTSCVTPDSLPSPMISELVFPSDTSIDLHPSDQNSQNPSQANASASSNVVVTTISSLEDPLGYIMEVYDKLLAPSFPGGQASSSTDTIKRCLYRKYYADLAKKELDSQTKPITTVDELIPLVFSVTVKAGFMLL